MRLLTKIQHLVGHQELRCWHLGDVYSLYYLLAPLWSGQSFVARLLAVSSRGSIKSSYYISGYRVSAQVDLRVFKEHMLTQMWMSNKALLWVLNSHITPTTGRNANTLWHKRNQNTGDILSAFPDWVLKPSGNRLRVLKMSQSVPLVHHVAWNSLGSISEWRLGGETAEMQMLTIADEGLFPPCVFLLRTAHVCSTEWKELAAKARIHLLWLNRSSLCQTHCSPSQQRGEPIVLKVAERVEH